MNSYYTPLAVWFIVVILNSLIMMLLSLVIQDNNVWYFVLRFEKKTDFLDKSSNYRYLTGFFRTEVKL